ncbi:acyl-CoA N-acyltransferase [Astrocystis sublimbata]|nr:acyl-CoA N-acyltransferase [Astrocystis sublimbata]
MSELDHVFKTPTDLSPAYEIRPHLPGDMGMIVHHHGHIYSRDYGWGPSFESGTARLVADFLDNHDPTRERVFVAQRIETAEFLGSIALFKHKTEANVAHLRLLLVTHAARGLGLGSELVRTCVEYARNCGYAKIVLWTFSVLEGARKLYRRAGFEMLKAYEVSDWWGTRLVEELWEMKLVD